MLHQINSLHSPLTTVPQENKPCKRSTTTSQNRSLASSDKALSSTLATTIQHLKLPHGHLELKMQIAEKWKQSYRRQHHSNNCVVQHPTQLYEMELNIF